MARGKPEKQKLAYISVPSRIIHSLPLLHLSSQNLLLSSPTKKPPPQRPSCAASYYRFLSLARNLRFLLVILLLSTFVTTIILGLNPGIPSSQVANRLRDLQHRTSKPSSRTARESTVAADGGGGEQQQRSDVAEGEFWRKSDGMGYRPCLNFSEDYRRESAAVKEMDGGDRRKYLVVVVSGGLNQQRNQIVDAVVIARILGATLVAPVLQVNVIWGDESEFSDIFDFKHFKRVLADDVKVVSSLPSNKIATRRSEHRLGAPNVSPEWIQKRYSKRLKKNGVLVLRAFDSKLSKNLPTDLQKLRCKVAFHALKFAAPIQELGDKLAARMRSQGPYLALHLRLEKDVWVRTGCLPGLSPELDQIIQKERVLRPELLTARTNMSYHERKLAGLCPLNAAEVTRLLKALEAPRDARIYWAGGEPLGGPAALQPLIREFPNLHNKENLTLPGELAPFMNKASSMAAIDYIVCEKSDVFMASHGGNMGHLLQGQRAYAGHKKFITPNKRQMIRHYLNSSLPESEFEEIMKQLHRGSLGQPEFRTDGKLVKDVTAFPVPECMCQATQP